ncbi:mechanosensitive ion channel [bacterium]|nr:mechanosensitive ion channel [bacterium]
MTPDTATPLSSISLHDILQQLIQGAVRFSFRIATAIVILSVGLWLSARLTKIVKRGMERRKLEPSLQSFLASFVSIISKVFVFVVVLTTVGVQMTAITAALGAAALAVGMALSGTMQNVAGGLVILFFKPFKIGDTIITASGKTGVVKKIMIFTTELRTFDNQTLFLPNGALSNGEITNLSHGGVRRQDLIIGISYGDNVENARRVILDILSRDARVKQDPAPSVFVSELADSAVQLTVRFWTTWPDLAPTGAAIREEIYKTLPKKKLNFPFPQLDVHVIK